MTCLDLALVGLKMLGITLQTIPAIVVSPEWGLGAYDTKAHVIYLHNPNHCRVLIHELIHDAQEESRPGQFNESRRMPEERDAAFNTMVIEHYLLNSGYPLTPHGWLKEE